MVGFTGTDIPNVVMTYNTNQAELVLVFKVRNGEICVVLIGSLR